MARNSKPIYRVTVKIELEVDVSITADSAQDAISLATALKLKDMVIPADSACDFVNWEIPGVLSVTQEGFVPFKK